MSFISMMEARLPPGFRFYPRDDELVLDYLWHKQHSGSARGGGSAYGGVVMIDVDLNKCEPWDLPEVACVGGKEWYFFSLHDRKYATGERTNRATQSGYWKATGKDRCISRHGVVVGMRKTLVFYHGRAPKGKKTEWVMHEFRMEGNVVVDHPKFFKKDWVLCKVFCRSRTAGPAPAADEAGSLSNEIAVPTAPPPFTPLADAYIAFDHSMTGAIEGYKLVSCFSGQEPAIKSPASSANLPASGTGDDSKAIRTVLSAKLEFPQDWRQEQDEHFMHGNGVSHVWNP